MRVFVPAALLLALAACASSEENDLQYERVRLDPTPDEMRLEPPANPDLQYMAWSSAEERALTGWVSSRSAAEAAGQEYAGRHPDRAWTILWRERPAEKMLPRHPRG